MSETNTPAIIANDGLTITASNGYVVRLKRKHLLWGERKVVKGILAKSFVMSGVTMKELQESKGEAFQESTFSLDPTVPDLATEKVFDFLVESITTPNNEVISRGFTNWLNSQSEKVAEPIFTAFNEATKELTDLTPEEKKS